MSARPRRAAGAQAVPDPPRDAGPALGEDTSLPHILLSSHTGHWTSRPRRPSICSIDSRAAEAQSAAVSLSSLHCALRTARWLHMSTVRAGAVCSSDARAEPAQSPAHGLRGVSCAVHPALIRTPTGLGSGPSASTSPTPEMLVEGRSVTKTRKLRGKLAASLLLPLLFTPRGGGRAALQEWCQASRRWITLGTDSPCTPRSPQPRATGPVAICLAVSVECRVPVHPAVSYQCAC